MLPLYTLVTAVSIMIFSTANPSSVAASEHTVSDTSDAPPGARMTYLSKNTIACYGSEYPTRHGEPITRFENIGKADAPKLTRSQLSLIRSIRKYMPHDHLWYTFLTPKHRDTTEQTTDFIVFRAGNKDSICSNGMFKQVLNKFVFSTFDPGSDPFDLTSVIGNPDHTPYPWKNPFIP